MTNENAVALRKLIDSESVNSKLTTLASDSYPLERMKEMLVSFYAAGGNDGRLGTCTPMSIVQAFYRAVAIGLDPINKEMGEAYLVPYGKTATLQLGYKGLIKLAREHGSVRRVVAEVVVEGEDIEIDPIAGTIKHKIDPTADRTDTTKFLGAYAVVWLKGQDDPIVQWLDKHEIALRQAQSKSGIWAKNPRAMWRKSPIRALLSGGSIPISPVLAEALRVDDEAEMLTEADVPEIDTAKRVIEVAVGKAQEPSEPDADLEFEPDMPGVDDVIDEIEAETPEELEPPPKKRGRGRPKGSKNKPKVEVVEEPEPEIEDPFADADEPEPEVDPSDAYNQEMLDAKSKEALLAVVKKVVNDPSLSKFHKDRLRLTYSKRVEAIG